MRVRALSLLLLSLPTLAQNPVPTLRLRNLDALGPGFPGEQAIGIYPPSVTPDGSWVALVATGSNNNEFRVLGGPVGGGFQVLRSPGTTSGGLVQSDFVAPSPFSLEPRPFVTDGGEVLYAAELAAGQPFEQGHFLDDAPALVLGGPAPGAPGFTVLDVIPLRATASGEFHALVRLADLQGMPADHALYRGLAAAPVLLPANLETIRTSALGAHWIHSIRPSSAPGDLELFVDGAPMQVGGSWIATGETLPSSLSSVPAEWSMLAPIGVNEAGGVTFAGFVDDGSAEGYWGVVQDGIWRYRGDFPDPEIVPPAQPVPGISATFFGSSNERGDVALTLYVDAVGVLHTINGIRVMRNEDQIDTDEDGMSEDILEYTSTFAPQLTEDGRAYASVHLLQVGNPSGIGGILELPSVDLGIAYCTSHPNSTGAPAEVFAAGSPSVSRNVFVLRAESLPAATSAFGVYGSNQQQVPFANDFLCVGGTTLARVGPLQSDALGRIEDTVDLTAPPTLATRITPGSTWNFQVWFVDPGFGVGSGLTDAVSVTFEP